MEGGDDAVHHGLAHGRGMTRPAWRRVDQDPHAELGGGGSRPVPRSNLIAASPFGKLGAPRFVNRRFSTSHRAWSVDRYLPASTAPEQPRPDKPVFVTIKPDETIAVGETVVAREELATALDAATNNHKDETIFIRGDKTLSYGGLMAVMNTLRDAGYLKLALVGLEEPAAKP